MSRNLRIDSRTTRQALKIIDDNGDRKIADQGYHDIKELERNRRYPTIMKDLAKIYDSYELTRVTWD